MIKSLPRTLTALAIACAAITPMAVVATAAPAAPAKHHATLSAKPEKDHIKVGEHTKIRGHFAVDRTARDDGPETLVVQELQADAWVTIEDTTCAPNDDFAVDLSFDVQANLQLRVFHPETDVTVEASSDVFALVVL